MLALYQTTPALIGIPHRCEVYAFKIEHESCKLGSHQRLLIHILRFYWLNRPCLLILLQAGIMNQTQLYQLGFDWDCCNSYCSQSDFIVIGMFWVMHSVAQDMGRGGNPLARLTFVDLKNIES